MSLEWFFEENVWNFSEDFIKDYPVFAHKVNDWDVDPIYDTWRYEDNKELIINKMWELYKEFLKENYIYS